MNCLEFEKIVPALAREGDYSGALFASALAHARVCARCDELLAEEQSLTASLRDLAFADLHREASSPVEDQLLASFEEKWGAARRRRRMFFWLAPSFAMAASAVVLIFALSYGHKVQAPSRTATNVAPIAAPAVVGAGNSQQAAAQNSVFAPVRAQDRPRDANGVAETASDAFILLPYGGGLSPEESASVVRVTLQNKDLAPLGVSAPAELLSADEVEADIVVGEDGTPRAIRFIR